MHARRRTPDISYSGRCLFSPHIVHAALYILLCCVKCRVPFPARRFARRLIAVCATIVRATVRYAPYYVFTSFLFISSTRPLMSNLLRALAILFVAKGLLFVDGTTGKYNKYRERISNRIIKFLG